MSPVAAGVVEAGDPDPAATVTGERDRLIDEVRGALSELLGAERRLRGRDQHHRQGGLTYAQLSAKAMSLPKGSVAYTAAEAKVQTVFQGTTLRGLLLEAYAFWMFGQIALIAGIAAFALAFLMAIMVAFGFWHAGKTEDTQELEVHKAQAPKVLVGV